ncbi:ABC transporter substrate-binding protein [Alicyclobacillus sp. SO9]|uniref:ABC transporter substrate-binding protein n=1 Tax=Alicyclobacillus sp. SO9 TaxID=2665646 RepID=UPI0018E880EF|nr:ABC transporter substrate-binding protein [Alicyclobacillus sp. SO9]QQE80391.1 ABC transporter substrate-binding protein [Alicyclobacillus sp. SO9]
MAKSWKKGLGAVTSISALGLLLAGCGAATNNSTTTGGTSGKPSMGGSILLDETQGLKDLDPALSYDTQSDEVVEQLYDQLVTYAPGTNSAKIVGMAAKKWSVSKDGKTYTFHLRSGMKFWNNKPVTAQSFIAEFQRVATKNLGSGGEYFIHNIVGEQQFYKGQAKTISGLTAPDKLTLKIQLTAPNPAELKVLAMPFFSAVEPSYISQVGNKAFDSTKAMGSGAFKLGSINSSQVVLNRNPNYWLKDQYGNQLPYLNQVTIRVNSNAQVDALNFQKGTTAWLGMQQTIPSSAFPEFEAKANLKKDLQKVSQNSIFYLGLNTKIAPFNNKTVRQAMEYAIDKKAIIKLYNGRGIVANQPLPPNMPGYMKSLPSSIQYSYNPSKAKALLKQAGVDPTKITLKLYSSNQPDQLKEDQSIQSNLQDLGFTVQIKSTTWGPFLDVTEKGTAQMFCTGWFQDYPDPGDFMFLFQTDQAPTNNMTMYSNKQVDSWLKQANTTSDKQKRLNLYDKATVQVMKDAPWVPIYYPVTYYAIQPWVHGWYAPSALMDPMARVWIDKGHSAS